MKKMWMWIVLALSALTYAAPVYKWWKNKPIKIYEDCNVLFIKKYVKGLINPYYAYDFSHYNEKNKIVIVVCYTYVPEADNSPPQLYLHDNILVFRDGMHFIEGMANRS